MTRDYEPETYWSDRLKENFNLRGTGHIAYNEAYNGWLYRAKDRGLRRALATAATTGPALDVGSGVGWVVKRLIESGLDVEGCDISAAAVERLNHEFPQAKFFRLSLGEDRLDRPMGNYGLITMFDVAYHIADDDLWMAALAELARVLRPGGALIVTDGFQDASRVPAAHVLFGHATSGAPPRRLDSHWSNPPLFRWLSRDHEARGFRRVPDGPRGALEYVLETVAPRAPHMSCAVFRRTAAQPQSSR